MQWINYHHLFYFWNVARLGSVTAACHELKLSQPTISAQLKALEDNLEQKLFEKDGRFLKLTEIGHLCYKYCDEIFNLGNELSQVIKGKPLGRPQALKIGISDGMPKLIAYRLIEAALDSETPPKIICSEDRTEKLLAELSLQELDLILTDSPIPSTVKVKAFNHFLGESDLSFLASKDLHAKYKKDFPQSLNAAPFLLPHSSSSVRRYLEQWFEENKISVNVVAEIQDSALMKTFAAHGHGVFVMPSLIANELEKEFGLKIIGTTNQLKESFYLISLERKVKHPAVLKICQEASKRLKT